MEVENYGDDPDDETFHDASDHKDPSHGSSQSILQDNNVLSVLDGTINGALNRIGIDKNVSGSSESSLNGSLNDNNGNNLIVNGSVFENNSINEDSLSISNIEHNKEELSHDFSQDAQQLPDSLEIQVMDTSGASLQRKKSELAFKEVPSGRTPLQCDEPRRKKGQAFSFPSSGGFTLGCWVLLLIALVGSDQVLYFFCL